MFRDGGCGCLPFVVGAPLLALDETCYWCFDDAFAHECGSYEFRDYLVLGLLFDLFRPGIEPVLAELVAVEHAKLECTLKVLADADQLPDVFDRFHCDSIVQAPGRANWEAEQDDFRVRTWDKVCSWLSWGCETLSGIDGHLCRHIPNRGPEVGLIGGSLGWYVDRSVRRVLGV